jgi:DNA-directed RNA polymerase specialized sigma24 family protein
MQELTELTRMVFHLRATEDLSFREIGELVGTTEQGARWHMHQARTRLLKQLAEKL